jgi:hypothetical protein
MPPNKPQSNYSKRPVRKVRLLKFGPRKSKSLLEEYFYGLLASAVVGVVILGKAGGLSGYDAMVSGLWVGGFMWFAWLLRRYRNEQAGTARVERNKLAARAPAQVVGKPLSPNFKPMIGPQWPLKPVKGMPEIPAAPGSQGKKPVFVYERPTLPDRKPKLPHNWPGRQDKKPKP